MTPADLEQRIREITCEGCRNGLPLSDNDKYHKLPHQYVHGIDDWQHVPCTSKHAQLLPLLREAIQAETSNIDHDARIAAFEAINVALGLELAEPDCISISEEVDRIRSAAMDGATEPLIEALRRWKCPACNGSRLFKGYSKGKVFTEEDKQPCRYCKDTDGLHSIAHEALEASVERGSK